VVFLLGSFAGWSRGTAAEAGKPDPDAKAQAKKAAAAAKSGAAPTPASQQASKDWTAAELGGTREPYAEITRVPTGKPVLVVHYPWRVHTRPSVEVRSLGNDESDTGEIRPLQFVGDLMKGEITSAVYDIRDKAAVTAVKKSLKIHGRECEIMGDRNALGKPAATIVFPERARSAADRETATDWPARAVFFPLDAWALDRSTLRLELPAADFAQPGRIRVWFYREGNLLWWKTLAWPGME
jgi:hypothetical protein